MEPIGIVIGLVLAAVVLLALHRVSTNRGSTAPDRGAAQAGGVPPDPGASRPAGPGAEPQDPAAGGGAHPDEGRS